MAITNAGPGRLTMKVALTTEDAEGKQTTTKSTIEFTVAEQRLLVERECGEPCMRMWVTDAEHQKILGLADWTCYRLSDGRWAIWRKESDIAALRAGGAITVADNIEGRRLSDEVE
jgi:hypothetical protein